MLGRALSYFIDHTGDALLSPKLTVKDIYSYKMKIEVSHNSYSHRRQIPHIVYAT